MRRILTFAAVVLLSGCAGIPAPGAGERARQVTGDRTVTTIEEDFDHGPPEVQLDQRIDTWGDRIGPRRGTIAIVDTASPDRGKAAQFSFQASFDQPYSIEQWKDSGLDFVSRIALGAPSSGAQGVSLWLKPDGFTLLDVSLVQEVRGVTRAFRLPLFASDSVWKEWKLPFGLFSADEAGQTLDPALPTTVEVQVPFQENWDAWHFRTDLIARCGLMVDDVGYWREKAQDVAPVVEGFDDERDMLPFVVDLHGSSRWMDYTQKDTGEEKLNAGVRGQKLALTRASGGPEGNYLRLDGNLELTPEIAYFHSAGQSLTLFLKAPIARPLGGARAISFLVRSDLVRRGSIEVQDDADDQYYGAAFPVIDDWVRVRIPFDRLQSPQGSLSDAKQLSGMTRLQLSFELPPGEVESAAAAGALAFSIGLDSFALEP